MIVYGRRCRNRNQVIRFDSSNALLRVFSGFVTGGVESCLVRVAYATLGVVALGGVAMTVSAGSWRPTVEEGAPACGDALDTFRPEVVTTTSDASPGSSGSPPVTDSVVDALLELRSESEAVRSVM